MSGSINLDRLGDLLLTIGSQDFGPAFYDLFRDLLRADECTVFTFPDPATPSSLLVEGDSDSTRQVARKLANDYVTSGFLNDPNLLKKSGNENLDIYITDANEIFDADYRKHYYDGPELIHELVVLATVGGTLYYVSFYRRGNNSSFGENELDIMRQIASFMVKALHRHSEIAEKAPNPTKLNFVHAPANMSAKLRKTTQDYLRGVLMEGPGKLSHREAEICAGIIMGYSTEAISLNCTISVNTVATHRKRAYAKLGISSQNELFLRYFSAVRRFQSSLEA
jgi:DNA-binding CsgD family transcriptional regulator